MVNAFGGQWTKGKLDILEGYLEAYTTALKYQGFQLRYVDAFAGTGYIDIGVPEIRLDAPPMLWEEPDPDVATVLKGSARLALEVNEKPFDHFIFVDLNERHARQLYDLKQEYCERDIRIVKGDANQFLQQWCSSRNRKLGTPWRRERAVIFLDPSAAQVDWETILCISETKSVDLWIWFPIYALTRNLPNDKEPDTGKTRKLDRVFGDSEWIDELYRASGQISLFGDEETQSVRLEQQAIVDLYLFKLSEIFPAVAPKPKWFRNSNKAPLFALMFAASNEKGSPTALRIANSLLKEW